MRMHTRASFGSHVVHLMPFDSPFVGLPRLPRVVCVPIPKQVRVRYIAPAMDVTIRVKRDGPLAFGDTATILVEPTEARGRYRTPKAKPEARPIRKIILLTKKVDTRHTH